MKDKMRKLKYILLCTFMSSFFSSSIWGFTKFIDSTSVDWQAIKLQESIESKLKRALNPLVDEEQYIMDVQVKLDLMRAEEPTPKKKTRTTRSRKVQFSNVALPQDGDDFVVFNKLGLEAPIVGEEPIVSEVSEAELGQKATIELYERFNLFTYLDAININIVFDSSIEESLRASIQMALNSVTFYSRDIVPQYNVQYMNLNGKVARQVAEDKKNREAEEKRLSEEKKSKDDLVSREEIIQERNSEKEKDKFIDRFKNIDVMVGLIIGALIIAAVWAMGIKTQMELQSRNLNTNEQTSENENKENDGMLEDEEMVDLTGEDDLTLKITQNLERLRTMMKHHQNEAILMIKGWTENTGNSSNVLALKSLVTVLTNEELSLIFDFLTDNEKENWKMILKDDVLNKQDIAKGFIHVGNEIVKTMMVVPIVDDFEISNLLLGVSPQDAVNCCEKYPELGVIFANVLPSKVISDMLKKLSPKMAVDIIKKSASFKKEHITMQLPLLKKVLVEINQGHEKPPFLSRIVEILPQVDSGLEYDLYAGLLTHLSVEACHQIAMDNIPHSALEIVPDQVFLRVMETMDREEQIDYLLTLDTDDREERLDKLAPVGSKAREVIDMELEDAMLNEVLIERLSQKTVQEEIHSKFVTKVRGVIASEPRLKQEVAPIILEWLNKMKTKTPKLKVA